MSVSGVRSSWWTFELKVDLALSSWASSSRARSILLEQGMVTPQENVIVGKVLNAAAMTYVAATITAIMTLLYYAYIIFCRRD